MHIVTWNCSRGAWAKKVPLLDRLAPDIMVIQECPKPQVESDLCLWFGDNPRQGIAVIVAPPYRLERRPALPDVPKYVIPVAVSGPNNFLLLAVWSKGGQKYKYVEAVVKAVHMHREAIESSDTVLVGDLNSNVIWDHDHSEDLNHTALVNLLEALGMVSAYHVFHGEAHGLETRPTYYFHWKEERPFHIDYCFIPKSWVNGLRKVVVEPYQDWRPYSDHRPLLVDVEPSAG